MTPQYGLTRSTPIAVPILPPPALEFETSHERITPDSIFERKCNKIVHIDMSTKVLKVAEKKTNIPEQSARR